MAKSIAKHVDKTVDRIGYWYGGWRIIYDHRVEIIFGLTTWGGVMVYYGAQAWRFIQSTAIELGWSFYVFLAAFLLFGFIGLAFLLALIVRFFRGKTWSGAHRTVDGIQAVKIPFDGIQLSREEHLELLDIARKFEQTNSLLIRSREDFDQSRKSLGRIEQLNRDLSEAQRLAEYHQNHAKNMLDAAATGSFDHEGLIDPYPAWYQNIQPSNESMELARTDVNEILKRLFNTPFDFNATPQFDENPHRVTAPNIDRLPREEFRHDYKRFYERLRRSEPVVATLPDRLKREIELEKTKLIDLGNQ